MAVSSASDAPTQSKTQQEQFAAKTQGLNSKPTPTRNVPDDILSQTAKNADHLPSTTGDVHNWSGVYTLAHQQQVRRPKTEEEVVNIIRNLKPGQHVRCVGSGLSFEPIHGVIDPIAQSENSNILLDLRHLTGLVSYDQDTHLATFRAGTPLEKVFVTLQHDYDRILAASPGVIAIQTLAGAVATGTHGQGMFQASLADTMHSMRVVLADGTVRDVKHTDSDWGAFMNSMGCLGVVLHITLRTVPHRVFTCQKRTIDFTQMLEQFTADNEQNEFAKGWWFPTDDKVHVWTVNESEPEIAQQWHAQKQNNADGRTDLLVLSEADTSMNSTVDATKTKMSADTKANQEGGADQFKTVERFKNASTVAGSVYQILCKGIPVPQINCEIAVPFERMNDVLKALHHYYNTQKPGMHYPFILRCNGASDAWLSPMYKKRVCWIGSLVYLDSEGRAVEGGMDWLREVQEVMAKWGGLPHLGKHYRPEIYDFAGLLPRFNDFIQVRSKLDPHGVFQNDFVNRIFEQNKSPYVEPESLSPRTTRTLNLYKNSQSEPSLFKKLTQALTVRQ